MLAGLLLSCHSILFSVFAIVSGHIGDIYEARKVLSLGFLLTVAAFSLLMITQSYLQILVVLALGAVGMSVFYPVGMAAVSRGWKKGISFGLFQAAGCMGIFMATLLFSPLVVFSGWRLTAFISTLPSLPIGLVFLTSHVNLEYRNATNRPNTTYPGLGSFILFYVARGLQIFGTIAVVSFMPLFAVDVSGLLPEKASFLPTFVWLGAVAGALVGGVLSDYYSFLKMILFSSLAIIPLVFAVTLPLPLLAIFPLLIALGFCNTGAWVSQNMWLTRVTPEKVRGKVFGGALSLIYVANICSPVLFGFFADMWGLVGAYRLFLLPMFISAVIVGRLAKNDG